MPDSGKRVWNVPNAIVCQTCRDCRVARFGNKRTDQDDGDGGDRDDNGVTPAIHDAPTSTAVRGSSAPTATRKRTIAVDIVRPRRHEVDAGEECRLFGLRRVGERDQPIAILQLRNVGRLDAETRRLLRGLQIRIRRTRAAIRRTNVDLDGILRRLERTRVGIDQRTRGMMLRRAHAIVDERNAQGRRRPKLPEARRTSRSERLSVERERHRRRRVLVTEGGRELDLRKEVRVDIRIRQPGVGQRRAGGEHVAAMLARDAHEGVERCRGRRGLRNRARHAKRGVGRRADLLRERFARIRFIIARRRERDVAAQRVDLGA